MPGNATTKSRLIWKQQATALAASTTPPADALITYGAAPTDTTGIHVDEKYTDQDVVIRSTLTTTAGTPTMLIAVYGYVRYIVAQADSATGAQTFAGATGLGRWDFIGYVNNGTAVTTAAHPECVPVSGKLVWSEKIAGLGGQFERLLGQVWTSGGTGAVVDIEFGFGAGV